MTTVHDLLWRRVPEAYPARGRAWHEAALRRALRRSDRFIVPAEVVAADLLEAGAAPDAIHVIPMGSDHLPPPDHEAATSLLSTMGVDGPFLLSVGTLEPRKNLARLVEAYERIRSALPEPWPLVLVGPSGWGERVKPETGVVLTGLVTPPELSALYAMARLLAYVPLVEGFGLPPVEGMAFGTPVVASPLPSTAGAAFEVDPLDAASIAAGLLAVATDEGERSRLRRLGRERSAALRWSGIARQHVEVWEQARRLGSGAAVAEAPLRLSLDVSAVPVHAVGAGQYTLQLAGALAARADVDLTLYGRQDDRARWRDVAPGRPAGGRRPRVRVPSVWPGSSSGCRPVGPIRRVGPPRAALHHARAHHGPDGGHRPRPELLRGARSGTSGPRSCCSVGPSPGRPTGPRPWSARAA